MQALSLQTPNNLLQFGERMRVDEFSFSNPRLWPPEDYTFSINVQTMQSHSPILAQAMVIRKNHTPPQKQDQTLNFAQLMVSSMLPTQHQLFPLYIMLTGGPAPSSQHICLPPGLPSMPPPSSCLQETTNPREQSCPLFFQAE